MRLLGAPVLALRSVPQPDTLSRPIYKNIPPVMTILYLSVAYSPDCLLLN